MNLEEMKIDSNWPDHGEVPEAVKRYAEENAKLSNRYVRWLYVIGDDVYTRMWAFKKTKTYGFQMTEVERRYTGEELCIQKNMMFTGYSGFIVRYTKNQRSTAIYYYSDWSEWFDKWGKEVPAGVISEILNLDELFQSEKFKYCGYSGKDDLIDYIREYKKDPQIEFFGKMNLKISKALYKKCKLDRQFIAFLKNNLSDLKRYNTQTFLYAYNHHISFSDAAKHLIEIRNATQCFSGMWKKKELKPDILRVHDYCKKNSIPYSHYMDYWKACVELGLNMKDTKNIYPKEFQRMHDLRIDEYASLMAQKDMEKNKELNESFEQQSKKWKQFETVGKEFLIVIPDKIYDLKREGEFLHHCVGKMGYDKKMSEGRCVIAFLRKKEEPEKPYVTMEYNPKNGQVVQIYGDHDSRPGESEERFGKRWARKVTKALKELEKAK